MRITVDSIVSNDGYCFVPNKQWYPGHIAKTEKELKEQLKLMDVVIEVRDARIPMSTSHPHVSYFVWLMTK